MKQQNGYHWINLGEEWAIAEYNHGWFLTGCSEELPERFIKEIDERLVIRQPNIITFGEDQQKFTKIDGSKLPELKNLSNPQ